eukprot:TRINITY_DN30936_c0_g1_i1.p1 TRINITY_DN30936_c0_g1~~TRINITY_DN30936_c0_g1_i1.p1  ORF type:complete len:399 (+),score=34.44 TRINITY_DN30936_c0_g1_i1:359-1555(+)
MAAVNLVATLPSAETVCVDAEAGQEIRKVKENIALLAKLCADSFVLTFDGEEVGGAADGRLVRDIPFEDQSTLVIELGSRRTALLKLYELGYKEKDFQERVVWELTEKYAKGNIKRSEEIDARYCEILTLMRDADVCVDVPIRDIAKAGFVKCLEVILSDPTVDVNRKDMVQQTALHCALRLDVAAMLLDKAADVHAKNKWGETPLFCACRVITKSGFARLLLEHGADVNTRNDTHRTALQEAANCGNVHVITLLLDYGADVNESGDSSPLHWAARHPCEDALVLLLDRGANLHATSRDGLTPLHVAAESREPRNVALLLRLGADVHARARGMTALHSAALKHTSFRNFEHNSDTRFQEVVTLLLAHGADPSIKNNEDRTPFDLLHPDAKQDFACLRP